MAKFTRKAIMDFFLDIFKVNNIYKITVIDICEKCEINRNTFYYYFKDIYDVIDSIFRDETQNMLQLEEELTFYETYNRAASIIIEHRSAIIHLYNSKNKEIVVNYIDEISNILVRKFVEKNVKNRNLTDGDIRFITSFYSYAIVGVTSKWIEEGMPPYNVDLIKRTSDSFEATIDMMIQTCEKNNV